MVLAKTPCFREFCEERALPSSVRGPVLSCAFAVLAACWSVVMRVSDPFKCYEKAFHAKKQGRQACDTKFCPGVVLPG